MDTTEAQTPVRSQSRLPPVLLWLVLAAALVRIVTAVMDRGGADGTGLIRWQPRESAAERAATLRKPILYDFTAAWCGPCKLLDQDWADAAIADKINDEFVAVRIVDRQREDGRNAPDVAELQRRYEVSGFPTLVVAAPDGRLLGKHEGYRNRAALVDFLNGPSETGPPGEIRAP